MHLLDVFFFKNEILYLIKKKSLANGIIRCFPCVASAFRQIC